jgi:hypothetical protein
MNPTLQDILNAFAESAEAGQALLAKCSAEHLATIRTEAATAFATIEAQPALTDADLDAAEQLVAVGEKAGEAETALAAAAEEKTAKLAAMSARLGTGTATADTDTDAGAGTDAGDGSTDTGDTGTGTDAGADGSTATDAAPAATDATPTPIAASAAGITRRTPVDLSKLRSTPLKPTQARGDGPLPEGVMIAAADVGTVPAGHSFVSMDEVGEALIRKLRGIPAGKWTGSRHVQYGLATIQKTFPEELTASAGTSKAAAIAMLEYAASEARLPQGSLVAAGGWCAPSETIYDVFEIETRAGMLSAPAMQLPRGGLEFSQGPLFSSIYTNVGFTQTEAQAIEGVEKTCFEVPCPDFDEVRLDLFGVCINAGILMNRAYPEFIARYLRGTLVAHVHKVNASKIAKIVAASTVVDYTVMARFLTLGAFAALVEALDQQARDYRTRHRMEPTATLEVILPEWIIGVMRSDLINRGGDERFTQLTDEQIKAKLRIPNVNIQYVYDYQDSLTGGAEMGEATPITEWPDEVEFVIYAAGTFVVGELDVITLDTGIYDFPNLATNRYNALFTEEGMNVIMRGHDSRAVRVPLCPSGVTGSPAEILCDVSSPS